MEKLREKKRIDEMEKKEKKHLNGIAERFETRRTKFYNKSSRMIEIES